MSVLSPAVVALLGNLQASGKADTGSDAPVDSSFSSLLDSNGASIAANTETDQSLVDTLYDKEETPDPVAIAAQVPTHIYVDNKSTPDAANFADVNKYTQETSPAQKAAPSQEEVPEATAAADIETAPASPAKASETPAAHAEQAAKSPGEKTTAPSPAGKADKKVAGGEAVKTENAEIETDSLAAKLSAKIDELSTILSNIAALLGVGNVTQISMVQIRQTSLTDTQANLGVNQPFVDLSDRFAQLIGAIDASQGLPAPAQQALGATFTSFQAMMVTFGAPTTVNPNVVATQFSAAQTDLSHAIENVKLAQGDMIDIGQLGDQLQKLAQWLGQFQPSANSAMSAANSATPLITDAVFTETAPTTAALVENAALADKAPITQQSWVAAFVQKMVSPKAKAQDEKNSSVASAAANVSGPTVTVAAATQTAAPIAPNTHTNLAANNVAVANAIENSNAGLNTNLSGQNSGNSGQGSDRSPTAPVTGLGASAAPINGTNAAQTASFSKALNAASERLPHVAEQIAFNIKTAVKDGASKIQIQLDPESLGKLHIKMDVGSDGKATGIVITADNKSTLDLLQRDARGLENALADAGIKAESGSLSFNLRGGEQQQDENRASYASYIATTPEEDELAPLAVVSRNYVVNLSDGLDIQI